MKEFNFILRVLALTLVIVVVLQFKFEGQTLETRATHFFGSSQTISWIRQSTKDAKSFISSKINNQPSEKNKKSVLK